MKDKLKNQQGFIGLLLLVIVALIILSYFRINIKNIIESETGKENFGYVWAILQKIWDFVEGIWLNYLSTPVMFVWNELFVNLIWKGIITNLDKFKTN